MRLLRLDFGDDLSSLDLHPLISVVSGLSARDQLHLFDVARRLASGSAAGVCGLVQDQGLLMELGGLPITELAERSVATDPVVYVDAGTDGASAIGLQAEIDRWSRQVDIDRVAVEEIRSDLNPLARSRLLALRAQVAQSDSATSDDGEGTNPEADDGPGAETVPARHPLVDDVSEHLASIDSIPRELVNVSDEIGSLIERWNRYQDRWKANAGHLKQFDRRLEKARSGIEEAKAALVEATAAAMPVVLNSDDERRLEELSDAGKSGRFGIRRRTLSPEEKIEHAELLAKAKVKSWTEYSMNRTSPTPTAEGAELIADAESNVAEAERHERWVLEEIEADDVTASLVAELEDLRDLVRPHLGAVLPTDLGHGLEQLAERCDHPDWMAAVDRLVGLVAGTDIDPGVGEMEPAAIVEWARDWTTDQVARPVVETLASPAVEATPGAVDAKVEIAVAERDLVRHRQALTRIDRAEAALDQSRRRLAELHRRLEDLTGSGPATGAAEVLAKVEPVVNQIHRELEGSIPILIAGELAALSEEALIEVMNGLEPMAEQVQLIMTTSRPEVAAWVDKVGLTRAATSNGTRILI